MFNFDFMRISLEMAKRALSLGSVPVGATVVQHGKIIAQAYNDLKTPYCILPQNMLHAEIIAMTLACQELSLPRLDNCDLYVTLEPCSMCTAAIRLMKIKKLVFGAYDTKNGGIIRQERKSNIFPPSIEIIGGIMENETAHLMHCFFKKKRS